MTWIDDMVCNKNSEQLLGYILKMCATCQEDGSYTYKVNEKLDLWTYANVITEKIYWLMICETNFL